MFEETYTRLIRDETWKTDNSHIDLVLDYLLEIIKLINTQEELTIFRSEWQRIETRIEELFVSDQDNLHIKISEINNQISLLLSSLEKHPEILLNQKGFENFYLEEYSKFFQESVKLKKISYRRRIRSKPKHSPEWKNYLRIYFSIV